MVGRYTSVELTLRGYMWYHISMSEQRETMVSRIDAKAVAIEKLESKKKNISAQILMCEDSVQNLRNKIAKVEQQIKVCEDSLDSTDEEIASRTDELKYMEEILDRFDQAVAEREELSAKMVKAINSDNWKPGDPEENRFKLNRDEEYQATRSRKLELDELVNNSLPDVNKIFYNRGIVSVYNRRTDV